MTCYQAKSELVPQGFGFQGATNASQGPTPYCPPGASKFTCAGQCCNANRDGTTCKTCNFYQAPLLEEHGPADLQNAPRPLPDPFVDGWTEIGIAVSTDCPSRIDYLTKSCKQCDVDRVSAQCNGCVSDADLPYLDSAGSEPFLPNDGTSAPARFRPNTNPWTMRPQNAYESKTQWSNYGIGYGSTMPVCGCFPQNASPSAYTSLGFRYGQLHAGGCKDNRCNQDPFYYPAITVATAPLRRFRLYAKPNQCGSSRWSYAVAPIDMKDPLFMTLARDPRQPPFQTCVTVGFDNQSIYQLKTGDRIYIPGQPGTFLVNLYIDNTTPYRANASVFRGYSPVRPLAGQRFISNSGLRNFTSLPGAGGLLRPF